MLNLAVRNTNKLVRRQVQEKNVRLGRLFTKKDTAALMAQMLEINPRKTTYTVLDPGAGTGILSAAVIEEICKRDKACRQIFLTCYETDDLFADALEENLERIRKKCRHDYDVKVFPSVYRENYLTDVSGHYIVTLSGVSADLFDIVIANPPTELLAKSAAESAAVGGVTQQKISAAYLFASAAMNNLEPDGQMVLLLPTRMASSSALVGFRRRFLSSLDLTDIHLFVGKQKNADRAIPLKKEMILRLCPCAQNGSKSENVRISTSTDAGKPENVVKLPPLPYSLVVSKDDCSLRLVKSVEEAKIYSYISAFPETLDSLGLRIATGLVLDARCREMLLAKDVTGAYPLIRPNTLRDGFVHFPANAGQKEYIAPLASSVVQPNRNMIMIKRVPAKSDARFLNAAVYLASQLEGRQYVSTHNKLNFIDVKEGEEMSARFLFGLYALLNSTIYDRYISIISKSGQVSAKELRHLPLPTRTVIENIGVNVIQRRNTSVEVCNEIVNPMLHVIVKQ